MNRVIDIIKILWAILPRMVGRGKLKKKTALRIVFLAPVYHTNMIVMVHSLITAGHGVAVSDFEKYTIYQGNPSTFKRKRVIGN